MTIPLNPASNDASKPRPAAIDEESLPKSKRWDRSVGNRRGVAAAARENSSASGIEVRIKGHGPAAIDRRSNADKAEDGTVQSAIVVRAPPLPVKIPFPPASKNASKATVPLLLIEGLSLNLLNGPCRPRSGRSCRDRPRGGRQTDNHHRRKQGAKEQYTTPEEGQSIRMAH